MPRPSNELIYICVLNLGVRREDSERFNVYTAWLNAESHYGSDESAQRVLDSALSHADTRKMYLTAVDVFEKTGKMDLLEQCCQAMCKKYSENVDVWLRVFRLKLAQGQGDAAQQVLERSFLSLPKFDHVTLKSQAGMLEYRLGDAERGRSIFEGLLHDFPRRLDLWSIYLDQEIKQGDQQRIR